MPIDVVVEAALRHIGELLHGIFDDVIVDLENERVLGVLTMVDGRPTLQPLRGKVWSRGVETAENVCFSAIIDSDAKVWAFGAGKAGEQRIPLDDPKVFDKVVVLAKKHRYTFVPEPAVVRAMAKYVRTR